jgi:hypothetical protein
MLTIYPEYSFYQYMRKIFSGNAAGLFNEIKAGMLVPVRNGAGGQDAF